MEIDIKNIKAAYEAATDTEKKLLNTLFPDLRLGEDTRPVTERIKTFEDAYCELGNEHPFVIAYERYVNDDDGEECDVIAYLKLRIIAAALNEGWKPKFIPDEYRWAPYFLFYTKDEIDKMDEDTKACVVCRGGGCISYKDAYIDLSHANTSICSRFSFKSEGLAKYAGKQFIDLYADFMLR